jgi:hypothetical protein
VEAPARQDPVAILQVQFLCGVSNLILGLPLCEHECSGVRQLCGQHVFALVEKSCFVQQEHQFGLADSEPHM